MKYIFLGGAGEVGGSSLLISAADRCILIDCGIRVNQQGSDALPDLAMLKETAPMLDAIFLSHAHADHVGALPLVHQDFPHAPIYATLPTQQLSSVMLNDAVRVQENTHGETFFTRETVEATLGQIQILKINKWRDLWDGWQVKLIRSGHILGAVSILLETPEGSFFYTGDVSAFRQRTIDGLDDVNAIEPDYMWCEATYGTGNHPSRTSEEMKLAKSVEAVVKNGGSVLIPSFALGRAQEILLILKDAMRSGTIEPFPVLADGLVRNICGVYESLKPHLSQKLQQWLHNSQQPMFFTDTLRTVKHGEREAVLKDQTPKCIIASSGMLTGGASVEYAKALAPGADNAIFLSGYQDAESPGRRLQTLQQGDDLQFADGSAVEVKCAVDRFHLSAHSDQGQLVSLVKQVNPRAVALAHGEIDAIHALRDKLYKKYPVIYAVNGKIFNGSANPEWLPPAAKATMTKNGKLEIGGEFTDAGITFDEETLRSQRWQEFCQGSHKMRLEGNRLIISKQPTQIEK
ncbi:MAG: MBL fold metallo-hydrolase [Candidatus Poribacteria bacterium]|nr:MBL fold metallo-hydrolase [Candidatus Poribacteria bacterium]